MSMSLREQLLQAGLISERQAKEAERQDQQQLQGRQQQPKKDRGRPTPQELAAQQQAHSKLARDQELNRQQQQQAERKARHAQIKQLIEQHRLPPAATEERYSFVDRNRIRRIAADAPLRARLASGEVVIVRCEGRYELVPAETAARIRERDERAVLALAAAQAPENDAAYAEFAVPDDLIW